MLHRFFNLIGRTLFTAPLAPVVAAVDPAAQDEDSTVIVDPRTRMRIYPNGKPTAVEIQGSIKQLKRMYHESRALTSGVENLDGHVLTWEGQVIEADAPSIAMRANWNGDMNDALKYAFQNAGVNMTAMRDSDRASLLEHDNGGTW